MGREGSASLGVVTIKVQLPVRDAADCQRCESAATWSRVGRLYMWQPLSLDTSSLWQRTFERDLASLGGHNLQSRTALGLDGTCTAALAAWPLPKHPEQATRNHKLSPEDRNTKTSPE